jgi:hypothetical protein
MEELREQHRLIELQLKNEIEIKKSSHLCGRCMQHTTYSLLSILTDSFGLFKRKKKCQYYTTYVYCNFA